MLCLEMNDKFQYADAMHTVHIDTMPEANVKGRGIAKVGEDILEFQTALAVEASDDFQRIEKIKALGDSMKAAWTGRAARQIPEIPEKPVWSEYAQLEDVEKLLADDRHIPIGYNAQNAAIYGIDLSRTYCYLITGKTRSGKTNLLKAVLNSAQAKGGEIAVFDFKMEMPYLKNQENITYIDSNTGLYEFFQALLPEFVNRNKWKKEKMQSGISDEELYQEMRRFQAKYFLIPDIASFVEHVKNPGEAGNAKA